MSSHLTLVTEDYVPLTPQPCPLWCVVDHVAVYRSWRDVCPDLTFEAVYAASMRHRGDVLEVIECSEEEAAAGGLWLEMWLLQRIDDPQPSLSIDSPDWGHQLPLDEARQLVELLAGPRFRDALGRLIAEAEAGCAS